ncbi:MAG: dethiobiotin synthase [Aquificae bacterium]|nr:dethiobiotin synthase [Aquificota bacterium]
MPKSIFVTATDTGVGKTTVSAALAKILKDRGYSVGYYKPVETGCGQVCSDGELLSKITGQPLDEITVYRFTQPVAPFVAQQLEGEEIDINRLYAHLDSLQSKYEYIIVEGAGGLKVPITEQYGQIYTYADFIYETGLPVLIVAQAGLGTINHTALTVDVLNFINAEIRGIILNGYTGEDISEDTNPEVIAQMTGVDILALCSRSDTPVDECYYRLLGVLELIFDC